jgi:hypothetical protein
VADFAVCNNVFIDFGSHTSKMMLGYLKIYLSGVG